MSDHGRDRYGYISTKDGQSKRVARQSIKRDSVVRGVEFLTLPRSFGEWVQSVSSSHPHCAA